MNTTKLQVVGNVVKGTKRKEEASTEVSLRLTSQGKQTHVSVGSNHEAERRQKPEPPHPLSTRNDAEGGPKEKKKKKLHHPKAIMTSKRPSFSTVCDPPPGSLRLI